jgi:hypothetical protein
MEEHQRYLDRTDCLYQLEDAAWGFKICFPEVDYDWAHGHAKAELDAAIHRYFDLFGWPEWACFRRKVPYVRQ